MSSIDLKGAMKELISSVQLVLTFVVLMIVSIIIGGVLVGAVTGGSITLASAWNTVLDTFATTSSAYMTTLAVAGTTAVGLVIVVFLVRLFKKYMGGGKGKSGNVSAY